MHPPRKPANLKAKQIGDCPWSTDKRKPVPVPYTPRPTGTPGCPWPFPCKYFRRECGPILMPD